MQNGKSAIRASGAIKTNYILRNSLHLKFNETKRNDFLKRLKKK